MTATTMPIAEKPFLGCPLYPDHDYKNPDFLEYFKEKSKRIFRLSDDAYREELIHLYTRDKDGPALFLAHWGMTYDPRGKDTISEMPMLPFKRQVECIHWLYARYQTQTSGVIDKCRDCGATWIVVWFSVWMWLFKPGTTMGMGSRKKELVDQTNSLEPMFQRALFALRWLPPQLVPEEYDEQRHYASMRIYNPESNSFIKGEGGTAIGRGGRSTMYFVDEKAFVADQNSVDSALAANTDCQIDLSTPDIRSGGLFAEKKENLRDTEYLFEFDYEADPRHDAEWEAKKRIQITGEQFRREFGRDEHAGDSEVFIDYEMVLACVDAHEKLGFRPSGPVIVGYDPADTGDRKAWTARRGSVILDCRSADKGDMIVGNQWAFLAAETMRADEFVYEVNGLGVGVTVDLHYRETGRMKIGTFDPGSGVFNPRGFVDKEQLRGDVGDEFQERRIPRAERKRNADFFENLRAQAWWNFYVRVVNTYIAIQAVENRRALPRPYAEDEWISISSKASEYRKLCMELSRPHREESGNRKVKVEGKRQMMRRLKSPRSSPNRADSAIICTWGRRERRSSMKRDNWRKSRLNPF